MNLKAIAAVGATLVALAAGSVALETQTDSAADTIPARGMQISPGWLSTQDSPSLNATGGWFYPTSPSTPYTAPNGSAATRYLLLDPRFTDSAGRKGNDDWWFIVSRSWPASYQPDTSDRDVNFHNAPGDAGNSAGAPGGIGWAPNFGSGVSALAFDYGKGGPEVDQAGLYAWRICVLCAWRSEGGFDAVIPAPRDGQWHTYVIHWVAGRKDGTTVRPGAITVWADGNDTPVLNRTNLNTVQRAKSPADGQFYVQRWMVLWEGAYTIRLGVPYSKRVAMTRIGRTFDEAVADRPTIKSDNFSSHYQAYGSFPRSSFSSEELALSDAKLPPSLTGDTPAGADFTWAPTVPQTQQTVTFSVADPDDESSYGWDFNLDAVADKTGRQVTMSYVEAGTKTVQLLVDGNVAQTKTLTVTAAPQDALPLRITSQTAERVTLAWTPPAGTVGYVFTVDGRKVSHTLDPTRSTVTFGKQPGQHTYGVSSLALGPSGDEVLVR